MIGKSASALGEMEIVRNLISPLLEFLDVDFHRNQ